jgi:hypothetical protein
MIASIAAANKPPLVTSPERWNREPALAGGAGLSQDAQDDVEAGV